MSSARHWDQDKEATVYIGNLDERVTDKLVWELMLQAGRIVNVHLPKDRVLQNHQGYGFVEFISEEDAEYSAKIMNGVRLYGKPIRVNKASADKQRNLDVGAELFIGNLDPMATEMALYDTFIQFGALISPPKVARDMSNLSKGYGFVSYSTFEASDDAIETMNGKQFMNREINVQYAYKKDGQGKRHGDDAERKLAEEARKHNVTPAVAPPPIAFGQQQQQQQNQQPHQQHQQQHQMPHQSALPPSLPPTPGMHPGSMGGPQSYRMPPGAGSIPQSPQYPIHPGGGPIHIQPGMGRIQPTIHHFPQQGHMSNRNGVGLPLPPPGSASLPLPPGFAPPGFVQAGNMGMNGPSSLPPPPPPPGFSGSDQMGYQSGPPGMPPVFATAPGMNRR